MENIAIGLIPGIVVGIIGFFIVKTLKDIEGKIIKNEETTDENKKEIREVEGRLTEKIDSVGKELSDHKELVQRDFITKREFAHTLGETNKKLDKIYDYLIEVVSERRK